MIRILVVLSLFAPLAAMAEEATTSAPEVSAAVESVTPSKELKRNEFLIDTTYAGFSGNAYSKDLGFGLGYNRTLSNLLQVGGKLAYGYSSYLSGFGDHTSENYFLSASVGPTFNFGTANGLENAYYLGLDVQLTRTMAEGNIEAINRTSAGATLGKRFQLFPNLSFTPHAYIRSELTGYGGKEKYSYGLQLLSASVLW